VPCGCHCKCKMVIGGYSVGILIKIRVDEISKGDDTMAMTAEIKGSKLYIEIDLEKPTRSASGKTMVVASTHGNTVTSAEVDGKPVTIGLNAYIKP